MVRLVGIEPTANGLEVRWLMSLGVLTSSTIPVKLAFY